MKKFFNYIYHTFIFKPLAGGNGVIQMDEMTKAVMVVMICSASIKIFASVCAIAAIKPAFGKKDIEPPKE
jgi:hypothetical protein